MGEKKVATINSVVEYIKKLGNGKDNYQRILDNFSFPEELLREYVKKDGWDFINHTALHEEDVSGEAIAISSFIAYCIYMAGGSEEYTDDT